MTRMLRIRPNRRISNFFLPHTSTKARGLTADALRKAGMPE